MSAPAAVRTIDVAFFKSLLSLWRASERWRRVRFSEYERKALSAIASAVRLREPHHHQRLRRSHDPGPIYRRFRT